MKLQSTQLTDFRSLTVTHVPKLITGYQSMILPGAGCCSIGTCCTSCGAINIKPQSYSL